MTREARSRTRETTPAGRPVAPYTYTPGNGHRYVWDGGDAVVVQAITTDRVTGEVSFKTIDSFPVPADTARTATAFTAAVAAWL